MQHSRLQPPPQSLKGEDHRLLGLLHPEGAPNADGSAVSGERLHFSHALASWGATAGLRPQERMFSQFLRPGVRERGSRGGFSATSLLGSQMATFSFDVPGAGDPGSSPGSGRCPGGGHGNPRPRGPCRLTGRCFPMGRVLIQVSMKPLKREAGRSLHHPFTKGEFSKPSPSIQMDHHILLL